MRLRENAVNIEDFSEIPLDADTEEQLKQAAETSMGTLISEVDVTNIVALCDQVRRWPSCSWFKSVAEHGSITKNLFWGLLLCLSFQAFKIPIKCNRRSSGCDWRARRDLVKGGAIICLDIPFPILLSGSFDSYILMFGF